MSGFYMPIIQFDRAQFLQNFCFCSCMFDSYCDFLYSAFVDISWWRHQMEAFSALLAICAGNSPVPGEFPTLRPVTRIFDVLFDLRLNKRTE